MFKPSPRPEMAEAVLAEHRCDQDVPAVAVDTTDRYGGVALGVECAWPMEAIK